MTRFLTILLMFTLTLCGEIHAGDENLNDLKQLIEKEIGRHSEEIAVSVYFPQFKKWLNLNAHTIMHAASTMKVPVMYELYRQAGAGSLALDDSILVVNEFSSIVDGSSYKMDVSEDSDESMYELIGKRSTIRHLVYEMITSSSNLATNILIELISAEKVQQFMVRLGATNLKVLRGVEDLKAYDLGLNNITTAHDLTLVFKSILEAKMVSRKNADAMLDILTDQFFNAGIPAGLPKDIRVAHKTGSITAIYHDSGIVYAARGPYVLSVLTRGFKQQQRAKQTVSEISRIIYDWYEEQPAN